MIRSFDEANGIQCVDESGERVFGVVATVGRLGTFRSIATQALLAVYAIEPNARCHVTVPLPGRLLPPQNDQFFIGNTRRSGRGYFNIRNEWIEQP